MNECPNCGETLDLSTDDRGARGHGTTIVMVERGKDMKFIAHCFECHQQLGLWADIHSVEEM